MVTLSGHMIMSHDHGRIIMVTLSWSHYQVNFSGHIAMVITRSHYQVTLSWSYYHGHIIRSHYQVTLSWSHYQVT